MNRRLEDVFEKPLDSHIIVETYHLAKRLVKQNAGIAIIDAITALSGDLSGLQLRRLAPFIPINVDVITRQNIPGGKLHTDFIEELQTAMTIFSSRKQYISIVK